ncbi:hypothetical protein [Hydromonas duriensis]|uniref:YubB ferredoxin-like domain-containing protein n=1 Tax=Hydromonas duriensis TaxID=1527608 RepID=A0A4R6Y4W7_9BURK|nr:hypothetical protein [Hydromonas duriensis]TDR30229.1 hypothetical protein DFR44_1245 [Hydromonas duriensis]
MPNYCQNQLKISGNEQDIILLKQQMYSFNEQGNYVLDFNVVVPMPKSLDITSGGLTELTSQLLYPHTAKGKEPPSISDLMQKYHRELVWPCPQVDTVDEFIGLLRQTRNGRQCLLEGHYYHRNHKQYGFRDWYDWRLHYWGTKWGAMHFEDNEYNELIFDTAWSPPIPVIQALAEQFPQLNFRLAYAEEGCWFAGVLEWSDGCLTYGDNDADVRTTLKTYFGYTDQDFEVDQDN